ncbi:MAG: prepilin-type N-terminal cleavage/methylation domain-containing protein [Zoogloeaceae bacterium]|jgi:type IV pilus assembly protein PilW|nr:prepilin-type N-terminal cleavage/methylation domain-containing protein [Zoogloeaceae bacterium]
MKTLRKNPAASAVQGGFTLIELMVAAVIGLVVLMAVSFAFIGGRHAYVLNSEMMRMQENARAALETIRRDARMAGFHGCVDAEELEDMSGMGVNFDRFKDGVYAQAGGYTDAIPNMADNAASVGMEIHGVRANAGTADVLKEFVASDGALTVAGGALAHLLELDDYSDARVLISDCSGGGLLMRQTGAGVPEDPSGEGTVSVSGSGGSDSAHIFARGAQVFQYSRPRAFRVKANPDDVFEDVVGSTLPIGSLYYNEGGLSEVANLEELARGVEAFRVCLVDETDAANKRLTRWESAPTAMKRNATQVQVDLVLVSYRPEVLPEAAQYEMRLCGDDPAGAASYVTTDRRLRRLFSATMAIRNKITSVDKSVEAHDSAAD